MLLYEEKEIVQLFKQAANKDAAIGDIAEELSYKKSDVIRVLQKHKLLPGPKTITAPKSTSTTQSAPVSSKAKEPTERTVWTPELDQKVERMMKDDMTLVQIADKLNISVTSLYARRKYLKEKKPTTEGITESQKQEETAEAKPEPMNTVEPPKEEPKIHNPVAEPPQEAKPQVLTHEEHQAITGAGEAKKKPKTIWTPDKDGKILYMANNHYKHQVIADLMGVSKKAISERLRRIKKALVNEMDESVKAGILPQTTKESILKEIFATEPKIISKKMHLQNDQPNPDQPPRYLDIIEIKSELQKAGINITGACYSFLMNTVDMSGTYKGWKVDICFHI